MDCGCNVGRDILQANSKADTLVGAYDKLTIGLEQPSWPEHFIPV